LGAVDYILTPVVPEVLRAKVSVFVELRRQSARLAQRAAQLQQLTEASLAINAATSVESILQIAVDRAPPGARPPAPRHARAVWKAGRRVQGGGRGASGAARSDGFHRDPEHPL